MQGNTKWALVILLGLLGWFASGFFLRGSDEKPAAGEARNDAMTVQVARMTVEDYIPLLRLNGQTEAADKATVAAQTAGQVDVLAVSRGDRVKKGGVLVRLDPATRRSDVRAAEAAMQKAERLYEAGKILAEQGYLAQTTLAAREADWLAAKEHLARTQKDLAYTTITSPIEGVVEDTAVVAGDFVSVGTPVATVVRRDEILVVAFVGQEQRGLLETGSNVTVRLINGEEAPATVRFVATDAEETTRTYRVEAIVNGRDHPLPTGMTATLELPLAPTAAILVSHSALVLDDDGRIGLMTLQQDGDQTVARLLDVDMLEDTPDGVWLSGLGEEARSVDVIVRGQNGVRSGSAVEPHYAQPSETPANQAEETGHEG